MIGAKATGGREGADSGQASGAPPAAKGPAKAAGGRGAIRARNRGVLIVIAGMLALSGGLRLVLGYDHARAMAATAAELPEGTAAPAEGCAPAMPVELAEALSARETAVAAREAALAEREAALERARGAVAEEIAALEAAEAALAATIAAVDGAAEADVARLTAVYEAMKPKEAAALFDGMAPDFAAGFLIRMKPESAAGILAGMSTETAYAVSVLLAGRNARAPTE
jgi:flagellar motility protein MotE (MotC chaperone)